MKRKAYNKLLDWKSRFAGKYALMLDGARRVGKSWLAETFAKSEYAAYVIIDFTKVKQDVKELFEEYLDDLETFFMLLQTKLKVKLPPGKSLIVFDEVQAFPRAREAIKHQCVFSRKTGLPVKQLVVCFSLHLVTPLREL